MTTATGGCTDAAILTPGTYEVREELDAGQVFCALEVNGSPADPTRTEDQDGDGVDDLIAYEFTVTGSQDPPIEVTFTNAGGRVTRDPGYWFTHPAALLAAFECLTGDPDGAITLCEGDGCDVTADDAMAIFWRARGGNRPALARHTLAAIFNGCLFSGAPADAIEDALAVLCDLSATSAEITAVLGPLEEYNGSGTNQEMVGLDFGRADPQTARDMAAEGIVPECGEGTKPSRG
jgi:hypothetical protein